MKRILALILTLALLTAALPAALAETPAAVPDGRREVVFWHCFGGTIGEAVQAVVDGYNASQNEVWVTAIYQGAYDDCLTKIKAALPAGTGPDIFQMFELGTTWLVGSGLCTPFQELLDADPYVDLDDIEPALRNYYTYDGKMQCMPFNPSTPIMYYNKTAFAEAGLDPENPPRTFDEIAALKDKLTVVENGRTTRYTMGLYIYGWFFESFLAGVNANYVNNNNGRTGVATAIEYDQSGAGAQIITKWKQLVDDGVIYDYGTNGTDSQTAFCAGQTCMTLASTASLTSILKAVDGKFEVGTAYLPSMADEPTGGVLIGGANLWIPKTENAQKQADAWDFLKYATSAEVSAAFSQATGYFCANTNAYKTETMQAYLDANPNFRTAINQLHDCPINYATQGASVGVMAELRQIFQSWMELVLQDAISVDEALEEMANESNAAIANYNNTVK